MYGAVECAKLFALLKYLGAGGDVDRERSDDGYPARQSDLWESPSERPTMLGRSRGQRVESPSRPISNTIARAHQLLALRRLATWDAVPLQAHRFCHDL